MIENREIKDEINQLKKSKCVLIGTTSNEMENLRNIIKFLTNQIEHKAGKTRNLSM